MTPQQRRWLKYLQNFEPKKCNSSDKDIRETRETIYLDDKIKFISFSSLQDKYCAHHEFLPVKKIITDQHSHESARFRYIYFPKLLDSIVWNPNLVNNISWPPEHICATARPKTAKSIFKQECHYTSENIYDAIWVAVWLGTYWYHDDSEKRIHTSEVLAQLQQMNFDNRQRRVIISQIIDCIESYGSPATIVENLSYFLYWIKPAQKLNSHWAQFSKLMLSYNRLSIGITLTVDSERYKTLVLNEEKICSERQTNSIKDDDCNFRSLQIESLNKLDLPFMSIHENKEPPTDLLSQRIYQAESFIAQRENIQKCRIDPSANITRKEIAKESIFRYELHKVESKCDEVMDKDKRIYKQTILVNSKDSDFMPYEYTSVNKRTMNASAEEDDYEYKIVANAYCSACK